MRVFEIKNGDTFCSFPSAPTTMKVSKQVKSFINGVVQGALQGNMTCPITHELFEDPVFCSGDGQTYERSAIEEWLKTKTTSPLTHKELSGTELYPNFHARALADLLRKGKPPEGRSNETQTIEPGRIDLRPENIFGNESDDEAFDDPEWLPAPTHLIRDEVDDADERRVLVISKTHEEFVDEEFVDFAAHFGGHFVFVSGDDDLHMYRWVRHTNDTLNDRAMITLHRRICEAHVDYPQVFGEMLEPEDIEEDPISLPDDFVHYPRL